MLSGGSNLIVADEGFEGTVVRVDTSGVTRESADSCGGAVVRVAAGEDWDGLVAALWRRAGPGSRGSAAYRA